MLVFAIDRVDGKNSIFADIGMSVLEAGATRRYEGFEELRVLGDFGKEAEGCATYVFVGMLL